MHDRNPTSNRPSAPSWLTYFIRVPYAILAHEAYFTLPPINQMILIDFRRHRDRFTNFGTIPADKHGTRYAYGHCAVICHRNTYRDAMLRLEDRGFLRCTGQTDTDGESMYYLFINDWTDWRAPPNQRAKIDRMKNRIRRREHLDTIARCTLKVHPPSTQIDNPLLKFWAHEGGEVPFKSAGLPSNRDLETREHVRAHAKQEESQTTVEEVVTSMAAWRAEQPAKLAAFEADYKKPERKDRHE